MSDCNHERVMHVNAKADDRQQYRVPHLDIDKDGYAPQIEGLCHGDYIEFTVCLDCGTIISLPCHRPEAPPFVDDAMLFEAFDLHPEDDEIDEETQREWDILDKMGR